jgi:hypothetical protein
VPNAAAGWRLWLAESEQAPAVAEQRLGVFPGHVELLPAAGGVGEQGGGLGLLAVMFGEQGAGGDQRVLAERVAGLECCGEPGGEVRRGSGQRGPDGFCQACGEVRGNVRGGTLGEFGQQCPGPWGIAVGGADNGERCVDVDEVLRIGQAFGMVGQPLHKGAGGCALAADGEQAGPD